MLEPIAVARERETCDECRPDMDYECDLDSNLADFFCRMCMTAYCEECEKTNTCDCPKA